MGAVLQWVVITLAVIGAIGIVAAIWEELGPRIRRDEGWDLDGELGSDDVRRAAAELEAEFDWWQMSVEALEVQPAFERTVAALADDDTPVDDVVLLSRDSDGWVASMALAALAERDDVPGEWIAWAKRNPARPSNCEDTLLLRALAKHAVTPVIGSVLPALESIRHELVAEFVSDRIASGENVDIDTFAKVSPENIDALESFVDRFEAELGPAFRASFEKWRALRQLGDVGRVWERPFDDPPALLAGRRRELVELVVSALEQTPPRSVLLVGEHGVGKTALARVALDWIDDTTIVFETTAAQLNAGAVYIGELEGRVKTLVAAVAGQGVIWVLPELQETLFAGQHSRSPLGLLDALLPHIESGAITIVGEVTPTAAELLVSARPRVKSAFEMVRVRPLDQADTIAVARHALEHDPLDVETDDETLAEAFELAQQFLPSIARPGNLLRLLLATAAEAAEHGAQSFDGPDVLATLAASSGLPLALLDPAAPLPLEEVRAFFARRVLEQPEAVDCIVERIAMVKAGVTDPTRPLGVFLFVGPTGTGKTEIAKALAEFLFGSADRLVRLDMSEYQTPESFDRLLSDTATDAHGAALISSIRKDPFAVILLDEFEKAAQPVLDLFLQVFDDGRLTDLQGRVVDFRRSVIVLTSNVGSPLVRGPSVGFEPPEHSFSSAGVERAVRASFRPEFVNRLDRIVVFRPFERSAMRALLDKELADALARRGLRGRPWAVEMDDSAYAFLIEKGFSPELGARPLKRALERYLLAPLAAAIVEQAVPDGDQFLFITATGGDRIEVTFVDPDVEEQRAEDAEEPAKLDLPALHRSPRGDEASVAFLQAELTRIVRAVRALEERKSRALSTMSEPGFWDRLDRFSILADAEYLDRLDAATRTAERLGVRVARSVRPDGRANSELVELLSGRLYVLDRALAGVAAGAPTDVLVHLRASGTDPGAEAEPFAALLAEMYVAWAEDRGMHVDRLDAPSGEHLLSISGLGCGEILALESGLHVLEQVDEERDGAKVVDREHVRVLVLPRPEGPEAGAGSLTRLSLHRVEEAGPSTVVVRRYRPGRAPLVRDSVRGYRTGRLDRILAGDFDLYGDAQSDR
ncbi:MAG TPA: AAA family ATPase [Gaiellaceae bacterium]|nr:AAA family ATPase [Gaiellaceae bacterium]